MINTESISSLLRKLWIHIPSTRRLQFAFLLLLSFFTSLIEMLSISSALPFISVLTEPEKVYNNSLLHPFFNDYGFDSATQIVLPIMILFVIAIVSAMLMRLVLLWASTKLSFNTGIDISLNVYEKILQQPYIFHTMKNSSDIINVINIKVSEVIFYIIMPSIILITSGIMSIFIAAILLYFIPTSVIWVMTVFIVSYIAIMKSIKKRLKSNSQLIANESTQIIKTLQEGLGGIRDILIDRTQANFTVTYKNSVEALRKAQAENQIFGNAPKFFLEGVGMLFIAFFAYTLSKEPNEHISMIPILVGIVLSIQRLLPLMQQMFQSWSLIHSAQASLSDVLEYLDLVAANNERIDKKSIPVSFKKNIKLEQVFFQYIPDGSIIIKSMDLVIPKGSRIGFIGSTGSGKSTLIDIIMGLLEPTKGQLFIDDQALSKSNMHLWQAHISHVPQSVYLIDSTIEENIAFGIVKEDIDHQLVKESARKAQIADTIEKMPKGYKTIVGERGVQLSGGQRQRLGIARALYKKAQVIILDEATSALDSETEDAVINAFESIGNDVTLLMIAHRTTTLKSCTHIIELKNGQIHRTLKYEDLKENND